MAAPDLNARAREVADLWRSIRAIAGEDDDQTVIDTMDGETDAIEALRQTVRLAIEAEVYASACKDLADTYTARHKALEDRAERYRNAAATFMSEVGEKTLRLPEATITVRQTGPQIIGAIPSAADLPDSCVKFQRVKHEPSIKAAMQDGLVIPGLSLSNGGVGLTMRRA